MSAHDVETDRSAERLGALLGAHARHLVDSEPKRETEEMVAVRRLLDRAALTSSEPKSSKGARSKRAASVAAWTVAAGLLGTVLVVLDPIDTLDLVGLRGSTDPRGDHEPLTYQVLGSNSEARTSGRVTALAERTEQIAFSDGSNLVLSGGSSLRVRDTDQQGAELVVERGSVEADVHHADRTRWSVFTGPYEVRVVGTRFRATWDAQRSVARVHLFEGQLRILGEGISEAIVLEAGQEFVSKPGGGGFQVSGRAGASAPELAPSGHDPSEGSPDGGSNDSELSMPRNGATVQSRPGRSTATKSSRAGDEAWSSLVAHGKFAEVIRAATVRGLGKCIAECNSTDLRALADAARYSGNATLAREALLALRSRSPGDASRSAYLLGSLSEARGQAATALDWYDRYLTEAPAGPFAAESRAGKMRSLHALGQSSAARQAAAEYLRLYPSGAGAAAARQILASH